MPPFAHGQTKSKRERQSRFYGAIAAGATVIEACDTVPVTEATYKQWRKDPVFVEHVTKLRRAHQQSAGIAPIWGGDFESFRYKFFAHESPAHHIQMIRALEKTKPGEITLCLMPPGHGKTTTLTDWVNMILATEPNHRILYLSQGQDLVEGILRRVKGRMTGDIIIDAPKGIDVGGVLNYIGQFGPFYTPGQEKMGKPWHSSRITISKQNRDEAGPSFEALGAGAQIYGKRADTIILDDYQTLKNVNATDDLILGIRQEIYSRLDPDVGRIFIVGTRVAERDMYSELLRLELIDHFITLAATIYDGSPLWPDRFPPEVLERYRKKVGESVWWRSWMMQPRADGAATFDETTIKRCIDPDLAIGARRVGDEDVWLSLDPSLHAQMALGAFGVSTEKLRLIDIETHYKLGTVEAILDRVHSMAAAYRPSKVIIEANAFQKALVHDERLISIANKHGFAVVPHVTNINKHDETFGVARVASSFIDQSIVLPALNDPNDKIQRFIDELCGWRADIATRYRIQDQVVMLWFAWMHWQQIRLWAKTPTPKIISRRSLPWKPTQLVGVTRY